ncbi:hypothetical protein LTS18_002455, partial [Coniosporium uncinatum]
MVQAKPSKKSLASALQNQARSLSESPHTKPPQLTPLPESPIRPGDSVSASVSVTASLADPSSNQVSPIDAQPQTSTEQKPSTPAVADLQVEVDYPIEPHEPEPSISFPASPPSTLSPDLHPAPLSFRSAGRAPELAVIQATPVIDKEKFPSPTDRTGTSFRKAPPAPLNLSKNAQPSAHLHKAAKAGESDSEYDDVLADGEIPAFERGRRKTREDDDRLREAIALEQASRSRSKKKSK